MKIGVVGLGLIGGSIFKSLQVLGYNIVGISTSQGGKYENIYSERKYLSECDVVFVCSSMNRVIDDLKDLENYVSNDTIVADVSSLKGFVSKEKFSYNFIPSHPMAGTEFSGFEHSFDGLFKGAKWVLTPNDGIVPDVLKKIITDMGAKIVVAN
ncbi:MAG: prephenate dehydrogenase/arogenate dehydrogenase family protein, partial [Candidatus Gastranaerophilaceae bacterium]